MLVDGKSVKIKKEATNRYVVIEGSGDELNRFNAYCNNRYRGQFICIELPQVLHTVSFTITEKFPDKKEILGKNQLQDISTIPEKYNRSVIYLGKILMGGALVR